VVDVYAHDNPFGFQHFFERDEHVAFSRFASLAFGADIPLTSTRIETGISTKASKPSPKPLHTSLLAQY
jgi:hypothetical protein